MSETGKENGQSNEVETLQAEVCGYCHRPKRPEKATCLSPDTCQCPSPSESVDPNIRLGPVPASAFRRASQCVPQSGSQQSTTVVADTNLGLVEVISVREKHGYFRKAIPQLPMPIAILLCVCNVVIPGLGTLLSVIGILCGCKTEHDSKRKSSMISILAAFLQLVTAPIIVGWIWSVLWGITFFNISMTKEIEATNPNSML